MYYINYSPLCGLEKYLTHRELRFMYCIVIISNYQLEMPGRPGNMAMKRTPASKEKSKIIAAKREQNQPKPQKSEKKHTPITVPQRKIKTLDDNKEEPQPPQTLKQKFQSLFF